jgi:hypothetical protein
MSTDDTPRKIEVQFLTFFISSSKMKKIGLYLVIKRKFRQYWPKDKYWFSN